MTYYPPIDWTEEMDRAIKVSFEIYERPNRKILAKDLGISRRSMNSRIKELGLRIRDNFWPQEHIDILKDEWERGGSGTQIGILLGRSRNSVIGKANRLKLSPRKPRNGYTIPIPSREKKEKLPPKERQRKMVKDMVISNKKASPPRFYPMAVPITSKAPISIMGLNSSTCHAIVGHGPDGLAVYCGDFTFADKPYCEGHCAMYYQPPRSRNYRR